MPRLVDRDVAHEEQGQAVLGQCLGDHPVDDGQLGRVGPQVRAGGDEEVADPEEAGLEVVAAGQLAEEPRGQVEPDPAAVADALRRDPAAVRNRAQRLVGQLDDVVARRTVLAGQEADATAAPLVGGVVESAASGFSPARSPSVRGPPLEPHGSRSVAARRRVPVLVGADRRQARTRQEAVADSARGGSRGPSRLAATPRTVRAHVGAATLQTTTYVVRGSRRW